MRYTSVLFRGDLGLKKQNKSRAYMHIKGRKSCNNSFPSLWQLAVLFIYLFE